MPDGDFKGHFPHDAVQNTDAETHADPTAELRGLERSLTGTTNEDTAAHTQLREAPGKTCPKKTARATLPNFSTPAAEHRSGGARRPKTAATGSNSACSCGCDSTAPKTTAANAS